MPIPLTDGSQLGLDRLIPAEGMFILEPLQKLRAYYEFRAIESHVASYDKC